MSRCLLWEATHARTQARKHKCSAYVLANVRLSKRRQLCVRAYICLCACVSLCVSVCVCVRARAVYVGVHVLCTCVLMRARRLRVCGYLFKLPVLQGRPSRQQGSGLVQLHRRRLENQAQNQPDLQQRCA